MATPLGTSILYKGKFYLDGEDLGARDVELQFSNNTLTVILKGANGDPINEDSESSTITLPVDSIITEDSINPISSGAVHDAIGEINTILGDINTALEEML